MHAGMMRKTSKVIVAIAIITLTTTANRNMPNDTAAHMNSRYAMIGIKPVARKIPR